MVQALDSLDLDEADDEKQLQNLEELVLTVTKSYYDQDVRRLVAFSFGAMTTVFSYFRQIETTELQRLSKWFYKTGISRVQMRVMLHTLSCFDQVYFLFYGEEFLFEYIPRLKKVLKLPVSGDSNFPLGFGYVQTIKN